MKHQQQTQFAFEQLILEAFRNRDHRKTHWAEGLHHIVPHDQYSHVALHHQHAQYHQVLFMLENLFPQAAQWLGVRELARLALDFLENNPIHTDNPLIHAEKLIEILSAKRSHLHVAQLETLLRCGLACWKVRSAKWRSDLSLMPRERNFSLQSLIEHKQAAFIESTGDWSVFDLWTSACAGKASEVSGQADVLMIFRKDEFTLEYEKWSLEQLQRVQSDQRV